MQINKTKSIFLVFDRNNVFCIYINTGKYVKWWLYKLHFVVWSPSGPESLSRVELLPKCQVNPRELMSGRHWHHPLSNVQDGGKAKIDRGKDQVSRLTLWFFFETTCIKKRTSDLKLVFFFKWRQGSFPTNQSLAVWYKVNQCNC